MFVYYTEPRVIRNFITSEECEYLLNPDNGFLVDSLIGKNGSPETKIRKSKCKIFPNVNRTIFNNIRIKVSKLVNVPLYKIIDDLQISKYETGGFYKKHFDSNPPSNTRPYTVIIYLNDDYEGGETFFPVLNKKYKLNRCDALLFHNQDSSGHVTDKAEHSGELVTKGEKWICTVWTK